MYMNVHFIDRHMSEVLPPERNGIMKCCVVNVFTRLLYSSQPWIKQFLKYSLLVSGVVR